jgi:oligopeptide/dipeptide ABC transporter ATP-binding protein
MYAGKKAESATTKDIFAEMRHPYTQALMNAVPKLEDVSFRLQSIPGLPPDLSKEIVGCRFAPRCELATDKCRSVEPEIEGKADHDFACFHPVKGVGKDERVKVKNSHRDITQAKTLLEITNLEKLYPVRGGSVIRRKVGNVNAISNISLSIVEGESYGLVGESGCGKTTTGRLITGLEKPTNGEIKFEGSVLNSLKGAEARLARRNVQMMFQDPYSSLDPRQTVGSILEEPFNIQNEGTSAERKKMVAALLDQVGISPSASLRYPHEFSGGQRQRIGLARALALKPKLLIADEPVSALDVSIQAQILNLIKDLQAELGLSLVMISHDLGVIRYMSDTVGVMYLGKLVEEGPSEEIYREPIHPYTRGLLDAVPSATKDAKAATAIVGELPSPVHPPSGCRFRTRCPFAQDICATEEPAMREFFPGHRAACHFPLRQPVSIR